MYAIPGDHDSKNGLTLYNQYLEPVNYQSFSMDKYHFVFLDVMSGISAAEKSWLTSDLDAAAKAGLKSVIFMHTYNLASELQDVIQRDNVIMVDCGHTHYNEVANDGHTIYAATRSTGQATEGPVGFSITNVDNGVVSWKLKQLGSFPFVMITSPSDKLLMIDGSQIVKGTVDVRAKIWDDKGVASATMQIDGGTAVPLTRIGETQMWSAPFASAKVSDGDHKITVNVTGAGGNTNEDAITVTVNQSGTVPQAQRSFGPVGNSVGAYAEKGLLGSHTTRPGRLAGAARVDQDPKTPVRPGRLVEAARVNTVPKAAKAGRSDQNPSPCFTSRQLSTKGIAYESGSVAVAHLARGNPLCVVLQYADGEYVERSRKPRHDA